jgi:hypothetical protein
VWHTWQPLKIGFIDGSGNGRLDSGFIEVSRAFTIAL